MSLASLGRISARRGTRWVRADGAGSRPTNAWLTIAREAACAPCTNCRFARRCAVVGLACSAFRRYSSTVAEWRPEDRGRDLQPLVDGDDAHGDA